MVALSGSLALMPIVAGLMALEAKVAKLGSDHAVAEMEANQMVAKRQRPNFDSIHFQFSAKCQSSAALTGSECSACLKECFDKAESSYTRMKELFPESACVEAKQCVFFRDLAAKANPSCSPPAETAAMKQCMD